MKTLYANATRILLSFALLAGVLTASLRAAEIPADARAALEMGMEASKADKHTEAIEHFTRAIELAPDFAQAYSERCYSLGFSGLPTDTEQAFRDADKAIALDPKLTNAYFHLALLKINRKSAFREAIGDLSKAIEIGSQDWRIYNVRGWCRNFLREESELAVADFNRALKLDPKQQNALEGRAGAYYFMKKYALAKADFEKVIKLLGDETPSMTYYNYGLCFYRDEPATAIKHFDTAIEKNPKNGMALTDRGNLLNEAGKHAEALRDFDAALAAGHEHGELHRERGRALKELGRDEEAEVALKRAKEFGVEP